MSDTIVVSRRSISLMRLGLCAAACLILALFGLLVVTGMRAHARELALQIDLKKMQNRRHLEETEYQSVEIDGCEYLIFTQGVVHAATCVNPIHKGNQ